MVIGSLATLDLPMVVDLIGIFVLKGLYCTLIITNWFLQALSVIPRGSWGDVARRFTMIRWGSYVETSPSPVPCRPHWLPAHQPHPQLAYEKVHYAAPTRSNLRIPAETALYLYPYV
ncbi:hypothetical protein F511_22819 [Dorcoceras hygrometricum]|uniref:Uncharacterized protein n=1 Tax=Dorcoceras hygrometricum TaxID=472368 RepID=A0A2Z7AKS3_9LAMI|nr:hypothetical protein F511_22819 [Dorcoceras hygrometricum]